MRRVFAITVLSIAFLFLLALVLVLSFSKMQGVHTKDIHNTTGQLALPMTQISISTTEGTTSLEVELATTKEEEEQGLSGRAGLEAGKGMLFVFDPPQTPGFWMKDMLFSLDIIFINQTGSVVTIYKNLSPETYPAMFRPSAPAKYVLEVPAGFADEKGIAIGSKFVVQ